MALTASLAVIIGIGLAALRIDRLFLRMAAIYGHLWKGLYREKQFISFAQKEWASALREFSDEIIFQAVTLSRQRFEMPPTLPQFIQLCYQSKPAVLKTLSEACEIVERNLAVAEEHLDEISVILSKKCHK